MSINTAEQLLTTIVSSTTSMAVSVFWVLFPPLMSGTLNRVLGGIIYLIIQSLVYLILRGIFGHRAYLKPWAYLIHFSIFIVTGWLLYLSGL